MLHIYIYIDNFNFKKYCSKHSSLLTHSLLAQLNNMTCILLLTLGIILFPCATGAPEVHLINCRGKDGCKDKTKKCVDGASDPRTPCIFDCRGEAACSGNTEL